MMSSRGELGFIPNGGKNLVPNRLFFGSPGHPSKKGAGGLSQVSKMNTPADAMPMTKVGELSTDQMITKRTDWLEIQERRHSATINEQKSETNLMSESIRQIKESTDSLHESSQKLYNETQIVFGKASRPLQAIKCDGQNVESIMNEFKMKPHSNFSTLGYEDEWMNLIYPMEKIDISANHMQCFMRCKSVHTTSGQISIHWVLVFEMKEGVATRFISEFSLYPK